MTPQIRKLLLCLLLATVACSMAACTSTRSEHGVTIEKKRNFNPLGYIPGL